MVVDLRMGANVLFGIKVKRSRWLSAYTHQLVSGQESSRLTIYLSEIMKSFTLVCFLAVVAAAVARPGQYTDRYDDVDLNEILANRRLLIPYLKCALDQGKCTPDGKELKSHIREALENGCAKCTEAQRDGTRRVIGHLLNNEPEYWDQLTAKYDRDHKFTKKYETELRKVRH